MMFLTKSGAFPHVSSLSSVGFIAGTFSIGSIDLWSSLEGTWLTLLSPIQFQIYNGLGGAEGLTEAGSAALQQFDEASMNPAINCVRNPAPASMVMPDQKRITFGNGFIRIESNYDGATRIVHMDASDFAGEPMSNQGFTIGRWEGKTLVMETAKFSDHGMGNRQGVPSGSQKRLLERLTLNPSLP